MSHCKPQTSHTQFIVTDNSIHIWLFSIPPNYSHRKLFLVLFRFLPTHTHRPRQSSIDSIDHPFIDHRTASAAVWTSSPYTCALECFHILIALNAAPAWARNWPRFPPKTDASFKWCFLSIRRRLLRFYCSKRPYIWIAWSIYLAQRSKQTNETWIPKLPDRIRPISNWKIVPRLCSIPCQKVPQTRPEWPSREEKDFNTFRLPVSFRLLL